MSSLSPFVTGPQGLSPSHPCGPPLPKLGGKTRTCHRPCHYILLYNCGSENLSSARLHGRGIHGRTQEVERHDPDAEFHLPMSRGAFRCHLVHLHQDRGLDGHLLLAPYRRRCPPMSSPVIPRSALHEQNVPLQPKYTFYPSASRSLRNGRATDAHLRATIITRHKATRQLVSAPACQPDASPPATSEECCRKAPTWNIAIGAQPGSGPAVSWAKDLFARR